MSDLCIYDVETSGSDPWNGQLLCLSWKYGEHDGVAPMAEVPGVVIGAIASPSVTKVTHSKYDSRFMRLAGYTVRGPHHDTMKMGHILNENTSLSLEDMANLYLHKEMDKRINRAQNQLWFKLDDGTRINMKQFETLPQDGPEWAQLLDYCHRDTEAESELYSYLLTQLTKQLWLRYWSDEEVPFTNILLDMECRGLPIDLDQAEQLKTTLSAELDQRETGLRDALGYEINFGSADQLRAVLFTKVWKQQDRIEITKDERDCLRHRPGHEEHDGSCAKPTIPDGVDLVAVGTKYATVDWYRRGFGLAETPPTEKTKKPSTRTGDLMVFHGEHPFVQDLLAYRKVDKVISTYLNTYPMHSRDGRLYGHFNQSGTVTGRLSSSGPNLENQPAHGPLGVAIRQLFRGHLIVGDHSQLEPRLMAHFSLDPVLLDIYRGGKDIYLVTADYIFGRKVEKHEPERQICKTLVLALGYGAGPPKVAQILALNGYPTSVDSAREYMRHLEKLYSTFFDWKKWTIAYGKDKGYVKTVGGRFRRLKWSFGAAAWKVRNKGERQAVNSVIQGSAADILRRNMLHCRQYEPAILLLNQVHDELIWEYQFGTPDLTQIQHTCERPGYELQVPLKFEPSFCETWADKGNDTVEIPEEWLEEVATVEN